MQLEPTDEQGQAASKWACRGRVRPPIQRRPDPQIVVCYQNTTPARARAPRLPAGQASTKKLAEGTGDAGMTILAAVALGQSSPNLPEARRRSAKGCTVPAAYIMSRLAREGHTWPWWTR